MSDDRSTRPTVYQSEWTAGEPVGIFVVRAIGALSNETPTELPPLYEAVDPEALAGLVQSERARLVEVEFRYYGYLITVTSHGDISVSRPVAEE